MNHTHFSLPFHKYSALGNHFCLFDETDRSLVPEKDKLFFAQEYTASEYGIGCDSMLFVQPPTYQTFIDLAGRYGGIWQQNGSYRTVRELIAGNSAEAHAIMRILEPCGQESAMCGNGLRCVADYLCNKLNTDRVKIIAEVTTGNPSVYEVERAGMSKYRIRMQAPRPLPDQFKGEGFDRYARKVHSVVEAFDIPLPQRLADMAGTRILHCYVTFTGEPHLVCFCSGRPTIERASVSEHCGLKGIFARSAAFRSRLLTEIADYLNEKMRSMSPGEIFNPAEGINVSLAQCEAQTRNHILVQVYERGIWGITKACGTGATAVASISMELGIIRSSRAVIVCEGSHYRNPGSYSTPGYVRYCGEMIVQRQDGSWFLTGPAERVFSGEIINFQGALMGRKEHIRLLSYNRSRTTGIEHSHGQPYEKEFAA